MLAMCQTLRNLELKAPRFTGPGEAPVAERSFSQAGLDNFYRRRSRSGGMLVGQETSFSRQQRQNAWDYARNLRNAGRDVTVIDPKRPHAQSQWGTADAPGPNQRRARAVRFPGERGYNANRRPRPLRRTGTQRPAFSREHMARYGTSSRPLGSF